MNNNKSNKQTSRFWWKSAGGALLLLMGIWVFLQWSGAVPGALGAPLSASARVAQVWENVRNSTQYDFSADVEIKTIPLPTAGNIGRFSKTDSLYLEGTNNLDQSTMQMAMWGGGVSVADRTNAYQVRSENGRTQTRVGAGAWQSSNENAVAFAPEGDFLAFLEMAKNVALSSKHDSSSGDTYFTVYTFDLDSHSYATKLAAITQKQLVSSGQLPDGASVQMPEHLAKMTGSGELWVDARGLPVRQKVTLSMPPAAGADSRTETVMDILFSDYQTNPPLFASVPWLQPLERSLARMDLPSPAETGMGFGLFLLVLLGMMALIRPSHRTYMGVTVVTLFAIVLTPSLQAQASSLAFDRLSARQAEQTAVEEARNAEQKMLESQRSAVEAAPYAPPEAALSVSDSAPALQSATLDSDGDGLTDAQEALIGTSPFSTDSDFDLIADNVELNGFSYGGKQWVGNPMLVDSNQDGVPDSSEWNPAAPDTDGDGTPDLYDYDNDDDSVPDEVDISRQVGSKANNGTTITFSETNPLQLSIDGLNPGSYTFVDLQLRPTNPDRLWYAFNVFNWPKDEKGNAQDWDGATFFDYCKSTGGTNCQMSPEANGDLKFVPMLEVTLPDLSNLPRRANGSLDTDLLDHYGIVIQPAGNGSYLAYVPLTLVEDRATGNKVAFRAQLVYQPGAKWNAQQARLVWTINMLNEQYSDTKTAQETLKKNGGKGNNQVTILHAYYDEFYLTGFNAREDRGVDTAIVYEDPALDPAPNDDDALFQMTIGLRSSFFGNRDCDAVDNAGKCIGNGQRDITVNTIAQRWNNPTNNGITDGQRWGIGDYLRVETRSFAYQDEATMIGGQQMATQILNDHFRNTTAQAPALLFVRETRMRTLNADGGTTGPTITWNGAQVAVNFSGETVMAVGSYNLAPYRSATNSSGWEPFPTAAYANRIATRYGAEGQGAPANPTADAKVLADAKATYTAINVTMNVNGQSEVLSSDAGKGAYPSASLVGLLNPFNLFRLNLDDEQLRSFYAEAFSQVGSRMVWMNLIMPGGEEGKRIPGLPDETIQALFRLKIDPSYGAGEWAHIQNVVHLSNRTVTARYVLSAFQALLMVSSLGGIFGLSSKSKAGQTAGEAIVLSVGAVSSTIDAVTTIAQVASKLPTLGANPTPLQFAKYTHKFFFGVNSTIAKAGAVGAVIGLVITWVVFFAAWGTAGLATNSVAFNSLVAGTIAATLVVVVTILVSLTVVGAIVLAVFAIFDLFAFIACKAGAKSACDLGISAAITKVITDWLYTGAVMIDTSGNPPISTIDDIKLRLSNPGRGLVVGNGVQFEAQIQTLVHHAAPEPGAVYWWDDFFTDKDIQSTSVKYALGPTPQKLKTNLNETQWFGVGAYSWVEAAVPSPVIGWLVPIVKTKDLWRAIRQDTVVSPVYPFATPQINQTFPLSLSIGMALPTYDCWFQVCKHKSAQSTVNQDLSKNFVLDILPATITDFHNWNQLGSQIDPDGDGLAATVDPNNQKWDTDGDGLPDNIELSEGFDPRQADIDNDGLNDAVERRYGVNQWRADTDGDGLTDKQEIEGYPLTLGGKTILAVSDPIQRDSDRDGISDGAERRLNGIDPVRYPFHPQVANEAPARLYTTINDLDRVLAVGASTTVTTTVLNGTAVENALMATGVFTSALPGQLGGAAQSSSFTLLPAASKNIVLNGSTAAANGTFNINTGVAADLVAVGSTQSGPIDDIILDSPVPVTIDSDPPSVPALSQGAFVQPGNTVIIGGTASDPTSYVARVDVSVNSGAFSPATGTGVWAFPVDIPNAPSGAVPVNVRAADAVNNTSSANFNLTIDGVAPSLTVTLNPGEARQVRRNAKGAWTLRLSGTAADNLAGIESLTVQIGNSSNAVYTSSVMSGNNWSIDYAFDDLSFNAESRPTGNYTLTVTARDNALPNGNPATQVIPFVIDMTPPTVTLLSHKDEMQLSDGAVLTGTVADAHAAVQSVEVAFVAARTVLSTGTTLLRLPLNDLPQTVLFENSASEQTKIFCLDASCPTSGVNGADGTAASFDGNDLLRSFESLDLPESGFTTALWFNTTCANCGLFSMTQGTYPAISQRDRELFLNAGKVCSSILVGASREVRCSAGNSYANGQWHQLVHTLGANGNALYVDGQLAVSSPTTASTFTTQDGVLVGYAQSATTPSLNGALDDIVIYEGTLAPESATALYRQWQPVTFSNGKWSFPVPSGLEGYYQIDMRASDSAGNRSDDRSQWSQFRGPIDTQFPTFNLNVAYSGSGSAAQTTFTAIVRDANLTSNDYSFICPLTDDQRRYNLDATQLAFAGVSDQLMGIDASCTQPGFQSSLVAARACDELGHCAAGTPPQTVAYVGTASNTLNPYGSLPNAIERTVLSDPQKRVQIIQRPGQIVTDIAIDEGRGKLYWGEMTEGAYAQPGKILRANLDGSGSETLVSGLTVYAPEALQIAVDTTGNKLYWTKGDELWWANLDGSLPSMVYRVPDDPRFVGGNHEYQQIGDVAIDRTNSLLYVS